MTDRRMTLEDAARVAVPAQVALSPDGTTVVYALDTVDTGADAHRSALWQVDAYGGPPERLTHGARDEAPAWSPDGSRLAFLRKEGEDGKPQVWLLPGGPGEARALTDLPGGAGNPVWSPDGRWVAFTAPVADTEVDDHAPVVTDRLGYKYDGIGWWRGRRRHVFAVDADSGEVRQLTRGDWHVLAAPAWSPDGRRLAFPAATAADADLTGESAGYVVDLATGERQRVTGGRGQFGAAEWTADGGALLVVGREDLDPGHEHLLRVPLDGGEPVSLTAPLDRNVMTGSPGYPGGLPQVAADGTVVLCVRDRGCTHLYAHRPGADRPAPLLAGADRVVFALSVARAAPRAAVVLGTPHTSGEVALVDVDSGEVTVLTDHSLPGVALFTPEERVFTIADGTEVHGWLLRDPAAPTPAPLLLDIHGGPLNAWHPVPLPSHAYRQALAARGWAVLLLNPRASDGYGEEFYTSTVGAWGLADERDFLEPVDALVADGTADLDRLAVTGYSYGGYMTCWLTSRTDRFRAAVTGAPAADLASMAGTSDIGHGLLGRLIGGLPYTAPEKVAGQSPYARVDRVTTPTLVLQGAADDRCPIGQGEQWFAALRGRGVPSRLVLYPGSSHGLRASGRPSHRDDYSRRLVDWVTGRTRRTPPLTPQRWQDRLAALAEEHGVPGAVLGVAAGDDRAVVATGVTNVDTGVAVTPGTLFQVGSITKVWTAAVVMRLVEAGKLDLDTPVVRYLPELRLADPDTTARVTLRHLLTHTSGIDGDVFRDTGRGDDCVARFVAELADLPVNHPLGATYSYCNSGYVLAGRVIEVVTGQSWDAAVRELLFAPVGLTRAATLPEEAILHRAATGHVHQLGEPPKLAPAWMLPRSGGPAGSTLAMTAGDLLTLARSVATGVAPDGSTLLSGASVAEMRAEQVRLPAVHFGVDSWGLGWNRPEWHGTTLIGHGGQTIGQSAFLVVLPAHDLVVALLTNGGAAPDLVESLVREVVLELAGVEMVDPVAPPDPPVAADIGRYTGTYRRAGVRYDVMDGAAGPRLRITSEQEVPGLDTPPEEHDLVAAGDGRFVVKLPGAQSWLQLRFYRLPDGAPYLHFVRRATPKVA